MGLMTTGHLDMSAWTDVTIYMQVSESVRTLTFALLTPIVASCGGDGPNDPEPEPAASVSGSVTAASGAAIQGASVRVGLTAVTTEADGSFVLANLPVGSATIVTSATGFVSQSQSISLVE